MAKKIKEFDTLEPEINENLSRDELYDIYRSFDTEKSNSGEEGKQTVKVKVRSGKQGSDSGFSTEDEQPKKPTAHIEGFTQPNEITEQNNNSQQQTEGKLSFNTRSYDATDNNFTTQKVYVHKERTSVKITALAAVAVCVIFVVVAVLLNNNSGNKKIQTETSSAYSQLQSTNFETETAESDDDGILSEEETVTSEPESSSEPTLEDYIAQMADISEPETLKIVNAQNPLDSGYSPSVASVSVPAIMSSRLESSAGKALTLMYKAMKTEGVAENLRIYSAYRSYASQKDLYKAMTKKLRKEMGVKDTTVASECAAQIVAAAGTSEHQLATCVDFCIGETLSMDFLSTEAGKWLLENSYKFGYILRYPADKLDICKRTYEPWHFRYVGVTAASAMYQSNLCLEEYIAQNNG